MCRFNLTQSATTDSLRRKGLRIGSLVFLLSAAASAAFAQSTGKPVRATIPPNKQTLVPFETLPNAECATSGPDENGELRTHKLYADDSGVVRLYMTAPDAIEQRLQITFECTAGAQSESVGVELRAAHEPTATMPAPRTELAKRKLGKTRAPLPADPAAIPQEELLRMGYPPRPDPVSEPDGYAEWLRQTSEPLQVIEPKAVTDDVTWGPARSQSWSGYVLEPGCSIFTTCISFNTVAGQWHVPTVTTPNGLGFGTFDGYTGMWVGMDGWGTNDVLQTGTASEAWQTCVFFCWGGANYYAWTEWYPNPPHKLTNLPVGPGDVIFAWAYYPGSGKTGYLIFNNLTTGHGSQVFPETMPAGISSFAGDSAEWIVERPCKMSGTNGTCNGYWPLAPFGWDQMTSAYAKGSGCPGGYCTIANTAGFIVDMYNGWTELAYSYPQSSTSISSTIEYGFVKSQ